MSLPAFFSWKVLFAEDIRNFVSISHMKTSQRGHGRPHHYFGLAIIIAQLLLCIWQKHSDIRRLSSISPRFGSVANPTQ